jgi:phage terminase small subunit
MAFQRKGAEEQAVKVERKKNFLQIMQEARRNGNNNQKDAEGLTVKDLKFVESWMSHGNTAQAYIDSHDTKDKDFTREKASFNGVQLLKKPHIKAALDRRRAKITEKFELDQERILNEYCFIAFSTLASYYYIDENGSVNWRDPEDLTVGQRAAIQDVSIFENVVTGSRRISKIKLYNKMSALDSLSKITGLFDEYAKKKSPTVNIALDEIISNLPPGIGELVRERMIFEMNNDRQENAEARVIN